MKKIILLACVALVAVCALADEKPGLVVKKTDGTQVDVVLSQLLSIKFDDGSMVINGKDGSKAVIALDDVALMSFDNISTAIKAIVGSESSEGCEMVIADLSGRVVYRGSSTGDVPASLHGVYIISVGGKSHKIAIK